MTLPPRNARNMSTSKNSSHEDAVRKTSARQSPKQLAQHFADKMRELEVQARDVEAGLRSGDIDLDDFAE